MMQDPMDVLFAGLREDNRLIQAEAARLLGELGSRDAVGPLLDYVRYSRWHAKTTGFHALAQIGDRSVCDVIRPLVDLPNSSNDWYWYGCRSVRAAAAVALLTLGDEGGAHYLTELADKGDDVFYAWFAPALLRLPDDPPAAAALKKRITVESFLQEGSRQVRRTDPGVIAMIAEALGVIGTDAAREVLMELLQFRSRYVRGQATLSLMEATPTDEQVAAVEDVAENDPTDFARIKASLALAKAGRAEYGDKLRTSVDRCDDSFDEAVAVEAIGILGRSEDFDLVATRLRHEAPYVRQCAVEALERIDPDAAAERAEACRQDPEIRVRMQAAKLDAARKGAQQ